MRISDWSSDVCSSDLLEAFSKDAMLSAADRATVETAAKALTTQSALIETLTRERDEARTECEEQARLNGMGAAREAAIITRTEAAAAAMANARHSAPQEAITKTERAEVNAPHHKRPPAD